MTTTTNLPPFSVNAAPQEGTMVFHLEGRLMDQPGADDLLKALDGNLKDNVKQNVVLDMSKLLYMNSTGLNIMISVLTRTRKTGGEVVLAGLSTGVRQLFIVTKLDTVFPITASVDEALAKLGA